MFSKLGDEEVINDEQYADPEKLVCSMHGQKKLVCSMYGQKKVFSVTEARLEMFLKKNKPKIGKSPISCAKKMDGSSLPPCSPDILQKLRRQITSAVSGLMHIRLPHRTFYQVNADGFSKMIVTD